MKILDLVCFYHNEGIPEEIFERAAFARERRIRKGLWHPLAEGKASLDGLLEFDDNGRWDDVPFRFGAKLLGQFSLVKEDIRRGTISMHVLLHSWARDRMDPEYMAQRILCAKTILCCAAPTSKKPEPHDSYFLRKLYPHAKVLQQYADIQYEEELSQSSLDMTFGYLAQEEGDYDEAERAYLRVISAWKVEVDDDDRTLRKAKSRLAGLYEMRAWYGQAEALRLEVAQSVDQLIGANTYEAVSAWTDLVGTYMLQSSFEAAENALIQAMKRRMCILKTENPNHEKLASMTKYLDTIRRLKTDTWDRGSIEELQAELDKCLQEYDEWDKRTLDARHSLGAALLEVPERVDEAEPHLTEYAHGYANIYGPDDPRTLRAFSLFAHLRLIQGHSPEAEAMFRDNLAKTKSQRGRQDIEAYHTLFALGKAIALQGRFDEGILLMERARDLQQTLYGAEHLVVTSACKGIESMIRLASKTTHAERLARARKAIASINGEEAVAMSDRDVEVWSTSWRDYRWYSHGKTLPELEYVTREEIVRKTRFPNLCEPAAETSLELRIELLNVHVPEQEGLSDEFA